MTGGMGKAVSLIILSPDGLRCAQLETDEGNLPVHLASMAGFRDVVELLLPVSNLPASTTVDEIMKVSLGNI
jgi:ankyrin repeat protein